MNNKGKIGRPRKEPEDSKTEMFNIMLTPAEKQDLPVLAGEAGGKNVSAFLREAIHYYGKYKIKDPKKLPGSTYIKDDWGTLDEREMASDR